MLPKTRLAAPPERGGATDGSRRARSAAYGAATPREGELVALPAGEEPSWEGAAAAIESLVLVELGEDVLEPYALDGMRVFYRCEASRSTAILHP
ncbi:MAG TPA: hypothetical protein VNK94_05640 [Gaiellaceae bacterium]|nr:hypothetical protein [Gaiellaceae bacterium]